MIRHFLIFILIFAVNQTGQGQNQNNQWYFGNNAALDFNSGTPVSIQTSSMSSIEGVASVADNITGNLLFYTNGKDVWNANHTIMNNGNGLLGGQLNSSTQGVLIAKYPQNPNKYFIFTTDEAPNNGNNGLRYSVVDMTLDGGLGAIIPNQKNILIQANTTERLAIAQSFDGNGFWLVSSIRNTNQFVAFKISSSGVSSTPVISNVGQVNTTIVQNNNGNDTMGQLKINPQNNKIAVAMYGGSKIQICDFNNCSGVITNPIVFYANFSTYGIEFSPDGTKLYYGQYDVNFFIGRIFQLDLQVANIQFASQFVGNSSSINNFCIGALQLAPDNKIYIAINGESWLSAINLPNNNAASCGFVDIAVNLISPGIFPTPCMLGLPPKVLSLGQQGILNNVLTLSSLCLQDSIGIGLLNLNEVVSINWNFGDPNSGINNNSSSIYTNHNFTAAGAYNITAEVVTNCGTFIYDTLINIVNCNQSGITGIKINGDTCNANSPISFQVLGTSNSPFFFWDFGDPLSGVSDTITISANSPTPFPTHMFTNPGIYTVCVSFQEPGNSIQTICRTIIIGLCCNAIINANDSCIQNSITFNFITSASINSINWNFDDSQSGINNTSNVLSPSHFFTNTGSYNITLTIDATCGIFTVNFTITIVDCLNNGFCDGEIEINNNCFQSNSVFTIVSNALINSVLWNFGDINSGANNLSTNIMGEHLYTDTGTFNVNVIIFASCDTFSISTNIIIINCETQPCSAIISVSDSCLQNTLQFQIISNNTINQIQWNFGDSVSGNSNTSDLLIAEHIFSEAKNYIITAIVNLTCGVDTVTKQVSLINCQKPQEECTVFVPNAFTPDGNEQNDYFYPRINCTLSKYEFSVFNRWGERVFNSITPNEKWNGTYKNGICSSGVYSFFVVYQFENSELKIEKGNINLIR
jgi:gliding motility-associated-like protein